MLRLSKVSREAYENACDALVDSYIIEYARSCYDDIQIPTRTSEGSAGYDISLPFDNYFVEGMNTWIPTGIRLETDMPNICGVITPRSSAGMKYGLSFINTVPLIDGDDVQGFEENQIILCVRTESECVLEKGYKFAQLTILPFLTVDNDVTTHKDKKTLFSEQGYNLENID